MSRQKSPLAFAIPTLRRADLLHRFWGDFPELLGPDDRLLILDNGQQSIALDHPQVEVVRSSENLGVAGSWNFLAQHAFGKYQFDAILIAQDDVRWRQVENAKRILVSHPEIGLFLSHHAFSIQLLRRSAYIRSGGYDPQFFPCFCEDDDFALTLIKKGILYRRFAELAPENGSMKGGTSGGEGSMWLPGSVARQRLVRKWGPEANQFFINYPSRPYFLTNEGITIQSILPHTAAESQKSKLDCVRIVACCSVSPDDADVFRLWIQHYSPHVLRIIAVITTDDCGNASTIERLCQDNGISYQLKIGSRQDPSHSVGIFHSLVGTNDADWVIHVRSDEFISDISEIRHVIAEMELEGSDHAVGRVTDRLAPGGYLLECDTLRDVADLRKAFPVCAAIPENVANRPARAVCLYRWPSTTLDSVLSKRSKHILNLDSFAWRRGLEDRLRRSVSGDCEQEYSSQSRNRRLLDELTSYGRFRPELYLSSRSRRIAGPGEHERVYTHAVLNIAHPARFVEVGTQNGKSVCFLAEMALAAGKQITIDCVASERHSREGCESWMCTIESNLRRNEMLNYVNIIKASSISAASNYLSESIDVLWLNGYPDWDFDAELEAWWPKINPGGVVVLDDADGSCEQTLVRLGSARDAWLRQGKLLIAEKRGSFVTRAWPWSVQGEPARGQTQNQNVRDVIGSESMGIASVEGALSVITLWQPGWSPAQEDLLHRIRHARFPKGTSFVWAVAEGTGTADILARAWPSFGELGMSYKLEIIDVSGKTPLDMLEMQRLASDLYENVFEGLSTELAVVLEDSNFVDPRAVSKLLETLEFLPSNTACVASVVWHGGKPLGLDGTEWIGLSSEQLLPRGSAVIEVESVGIRCTLYRVKMVNGCLPVNVDCELRGMECGWARRLCFKLRQNHKRIFVDPTASSLHHML